jgi:hypothetical protein
MITGIEYSNRIAAYVGETVTQAAPSLPMTRRPAR